MIKMENEDQFLVVLVSMAVFCVGMAFFQLLGGSQ